MAVRRSPRSKAEPIRQRSRGLRRRGDGRRPASRLLRDGGQAEGTLCRGLWGLWPRGLRSSGLCPGRLGLRRARRRDPLGSRRRGRRRSGHERLLRRRGPAELDDALAGTVDPLALGRALLPGQVAREGLDGEACLPQLGMGLGQAVEAVRVIRPDLRVAAVGLDGLARPAILPPRIRDAVDALVIVGVELQRLGEDLLRLLVALLLEVEAPESVGGRREPGGEVERLLVEDLRLGRLARLASGISLGLQLSRLHRLADALAEGDHGCEQHEGEREDEQAWCRHAPTLPGPATAVNATRARSTQRRALGRPRTSRAGARRAAPARPGRCGRSARAGA